MKTNKKTSHTPKSGKSKTTTARVWTLPVGMQETREVKSSEAKWPKKSNTFTPKETGQLDPELKPDMKNPQGAQGGRGPLNEEGEGDRQNDELAELNEIEPKL
jgi:hypothetical protein